MKNALLFISIFILAHTAYAQECKVVMASISKEYAGECKKGLASGIGEAHGDIHWYKGMFKKGMPNGEGEFHYSENEIYTGAMQDGLKEGKGHYLVKRGNEPDSLLDGYWSGDVYRGNKYVTYQFSSNKVFDTKEVRPSKDSGNSITIETKGNLTALRVVSVVPKNTSYLQKTGSFETPNAGSVSYRIENFPASMQITLSNGAIIDLDLYKPSDWFVKLFVNL